MKPSSDTRKPYGGQRRSLVLALDIGTTFSGVSYAILEPGEVPKIHGVTRFPGQEHVAGNSKIPSIMYYDLAGNMKAAGAEADGASVLAQAEDEGWIKTELFKLRLRPKSMTLKMNGMRLSPLPEGKTAVDVFGDFLSYLFRCTHSFIVDTHANGHALWRAVEKEIQFVLSHPNGWEGAQQTKMRRAAVLGGLIPDSDEGKSRIRFVTEGEASLHACVLNGLAADVLSNPSGHGFIVADAGGGTLDISSYAIRGTSPLVIEEIAPPDCVFAGSVFVSRRARKFFEEKLQNSKYGSPDSLDHIAKRFDETTKRLFRDSGELQFVPFGSPLDKDLAVGIRGGQLKLTGNEVAALFEPSIEAAIASIKAQINASSSPVKSIWLVGGFAASPWLFSQLQDRLTPMGITVSRPDSQTSKAVADGAIGFYCDHHVSARIAKFMYGVEYLRTFDPNDSEHAARQHRLFEMPSGPKLLPDAFDCILARSVRVKESTVFTRKYCTEVTSLSTLSVFEVEIWCFRGGNDIPKWILRNHEHFSTLCYVRADLSPLASSAQPKEGINGKMYWNIVFSIEIQFGLTEFKARIKWVDNGNVKYGPASIVYNEMGLRAEEEDDDSPLDDDNVYARSSHPRSVASSRAPSVPPTPARDSISLHSRGPSRAPSVAHSPLPPPAELQQPISHAPSASHHSAHQRTVSNVSTRPPESERRHSGYSSRASESVRESRRSSVLVDRSRDIDRGSATPRAPEIMERAVNLSVRSTDSRMSTRTDATARLGETLNNIWGQSSVSGSSQPTPAISPRGEAATYFEMASRGLDDFESHMQPAKTATPPSASKSGSPSLGSKLATPAVISRALSGIPEADPVPAISKSATPQAASGAATPHAPSVADRASSSRAVSKAPSKVPSPTASPKAPTPAIVSKAATPVATPKVASKAPTPAATSKVATPVATPKVASKAPSPVATPKASPSGAATPKPPPADDAPVVASRALSPAASPKNATSLIPEVVNLGSKAPTPAATTPKEVSRAPSRIASKAPTPKATTPKATTPKATTPKAVSQAPSPKAEPVALADPPPEEAPVPPVADVAPVVHDSPPAPVEAETPQPPAETPAAVDDSVAMPGALDWEMVPGSEHHDSETKPDDQALADLWSSETKPGDQALADLWSSDNKPDADPGLGAFLTHGNQWGPSSATPKRTSGFGSATDGGSSWGMNSTTPKRTSGFGSATGAVSSWGMGMSSTTPKRTSVFGSPGDGDPGLGAGESQNTLFGAGLSSIGAKVGSIAGGWGNTFGFGSSSPEKIKTPEIKSDLKLDIPSVSAEVPPPAAEAAPEETKPEPPVLATPITPSTPATPGGTKGKKKKGKRNSYFDAGDAGDSEANKEAEEARKAEETKKAEEAAAEAEAAAAKQAEEAEVAKKVADEAARLAQEEAEKQAQDEAAAQAVEEAKRAEDEAAAKTAEDAAAAASAEESAAYQTEAITTERTSDAPLEVEPPAPETTPLAESNNDGANADAEGGKEDGEAVDDLQKDLENMLENGEEVKDDEDDNGGGPAGGKKKKGKKGNSGANTATDSMSRAPSGQTGGGGGGGGKKKGKGKKK